MASVTPETHQKHPRRRQSRDDRFRCRDALSAVGQLHDNLLNHHSATLALEEWCRSYGISAPSSDPVASPPPPESAVLVAKKVPVPDEPPVLSDAELYLLCPPPGEELGYRRVHLIFNGAIVSKADNWYVISRLGPGMHDMLQSTEVPFGKVVKSLSCQRITVNSESLVRSRLRNGEAGSPQDGAEEPTRQDEEDGISDSGAAEAVAEIPEAILQVSAVIIRGDNRAPLAFVKEQYQKQLVDFFPDKRRLPGK